MSTSKYQSTVVKLEKKVIIPVKKAIEKIDETTKEITDGTMSEEEGTKIIVNIKQRKAKTIKISRITFNKQVDMLKSKVEDHKITVKKFKDKVTDLRGHMTISLTGYQDKFKTITN